MRLHHFAGVSGVKTSSQKPLVLVLLCFSFGDDSVFGDLGSQSQLVVRVAYILLLIMLDLLQFASN